MSRIIVLTGGAGFIGSVLLRSLNNEGIDNILVVDNLGTSIKWKNLVGKKFIDYLHKDQFIEKLQNGAFSKNIETILHLGACTSTTETNAEYLLKNNFHYSKTLGEYCVNQNVRMIYASSAAIYGDGNFGFSDEPGQTEKFVPLNMYAYSKQLFDLWVNNLSNNKNFLGLRFFNVYGPNEYHKGDMASVIYKAVNQIKSKGKVQLFKSYSPLYKDGEQVRDFIYVKDCVDTVIYCLKKKETFGIYNLGSGKARNWNDLTKAVFNTLGIKPNIEYIDMPEYLRDKYQYRTEAEMNRLKSLGIDSLEFSSLEMGVGDYVGNYLKEGERNF